MSNLYNYREDGSNYIFAAAACALVVVGFLISDEEFQHWFLLPVLICGILSGADAFRWLRGQVDIFDPLGILGLYGLHFFFLAPLLHVSLNCWTIEAVGLDDWRTWLGVMASFNAAGLIIYHWTERWFANSVKSSRRNVRYCQLAKEPLRICLPMFLLLTAAIQFGIFISYGGLDGYILQFEIQSEGFEKMGWLFMISESFPILSMIGFVAYYKCNKIQASWKIVLMALVIFISIKILFGGLRGARSNIVFTLFWAVGLVHLWIKPISRKAILLSLPVMLAFMYIYGFYKAGGREGVQVAIQSADARVIMVQQYQRSLEGTILGDFGRSDIQAFLLFRFSDPGSDCEYALGNTYLQAFYLFIPRNIWPDRPDGVAKAGTEAIFGRGTYDRQTNRSSKIYGLAGEAILNFGPFSIPLAFGALGLLVGWVRRKMVTWSVDDVRAMMLPMLALLCVIVLTADLDNAIYFCLHFCLVPSVLLSLIYVPATRHSINTSGEKHGLGVYCRSYNSSRI
jgi:hypothetical protein